VSSGNSTALVVGASRGLGLGLATEFFGRGWSVIGTARDAQKAQELKQLAAASDGRVRLESLDIDSALELEALAGRIKDIRLDLLFVNAGISGTQGPIEASTDEELLRVLRTNAIGPIRLARRLLPQVVDGGKIAFMTSLMGSITDNGSGGFDLYRISKASLNMLTRSFVATSVKDRNVTVLSLHPGWVRTDMGGPAAPLTVRESVQGLANVLEARQSGKHQFLDYRGRELPW
jgi:NAD(P)-dependent dehydrogenase (short-subunit alcohol dehydrogenase family)